MPSSGELAPGHALIRHPLFSFLVSHRRFGESRQEQHVLASSAVGKESLILHRSVLGRTNVKAEEIRDALALDSFVALGVPLAHSSDPSSMSSSSFDGGHWTAAE